MSALWEEQAQSQQMLSNLQQMVESAHSGSK
jgi:hypothetical protein